MKRMATYNLPLRYRIERHMARHKEKYCLAIVLLMYGLAGHIETM